MRIITGGILLFLSSLCWASNKQCDAARLPKFADFKVTAQFRGKAKHPILLTPTEQGYRTTIRHAVKAGPNFAGHYVIARWGCGSGCHGFVVVDIATGRIFDTPFRDLNVHYPPSGVFEDDAKPGWWSLNDDVLNFRSDSSLLIVEGCLDDHQCGRTYYKIESSGMRQIAFDPDRLPDGHIAPF